VSSRRSYYAWTAKITRLWEFRRAGGPEVAGKGISGADGGDSRYFSYRWLKETILKRRAVD